VAGGVRNSGGTGYSRMSSGLLIFGCVTWSNAWRILSRARELKVSPTCLPVMRPRCIYGWFSNVNRGKRRQAQEQAPHAAPDGAVEIPPPPGSSIFKQRWADLIKKVYEADPLLCTQCGGAMRIIAFIDQPDVIEKILTHLGL